MKRLILAAALAALISTPAFAEPVCGPLMKMVNSLVYEHGEEIIDTETRVTEQGSIVFALWANPETKTWTLTGTDGTLMCWFRAGEDYRDEGVSLREMLKREDA